MDLKNQGKYISKKVKAETRFVIKKEKYCIHDIDILLS